MPDPRSAVGRVLAARKGRAAASPAAEFNAAAKAFRAKFDALPGTDPRLPAVKAGFAAALRAAQGADFAAAQNHLTAAAAALAAADNGTGPGAGRAAWQKAAQQARFQVRKLQTAVKLLADAEAREVADLLHELVEALETDPATAADVAAMEKYVQSDGLIDSAELPNPFGVPVQIRGPLLAALAELKADLSA